MKKEKVFITIITGSLRRGGAEIQLSEILPGLDKNKYKVEKFTHEFTSPAVEALTRRVDASQACCASHVA